MRARLLLALLASPFVAAPGPSATADARGPDSPATVSPAVVAAATAPGFLENAGRLPDAVAYTLDARDRTFFFCADGVTVSLHDPERPGAGRWVLRLEFEGARAAAPRASDERPGETNLFLGQAENWHVGLRSFGRLVQRDLWPGVDLVWTADAGRLKWRCDVRPGADPSRIRFGVRGAGGVSVGADGAFTAATPLGDFVDAAPVAWQTDGGVRTPVDAAFRLDAAASSLSVALGAYDPARELVVDPSTVIRTGFIGGALADVATAVAVDPLRNVYVAGTTNSPETTFPTLVGPDSTYNGGSADAFVCKIDSQFRAVWSGYLGGALADGAGGVAVDAVGGVYVTGSTFSTDFPLVGGLATGRGAGLDVFVTKIAPYGSAIVWSSVLGGPAEDRGFAIAVDRQFRTVVAGRTSGGMPFQGAYRGGVSDAFAFGLRADGAFLDWGTYLGGKQSDWASGVAMDAAFNVYLCGNTLSPHTSFPVRTGPRVIEGGAQDAWVAKLDAANHVPVYAGYIGGAGVDSAAGIAVDSLGRAYVVGSTMSDELTFPVVVGPHLVHRGKNDAFVARVAADGGSLEYCGFIGGSGHDLGYAIALDANRRAYVVGTTGSTESGYPADRAMFPVVDGPDLTFNGGVHDAWIGVVEPDGSQMTSLGYIGGTGGIEDATAVAVHLNGDVVVVGDTVSPAKSFPGGTGPLIVASGGRDAFLTQLQFTLPSPLLLVPTLDAVTPSGFAVDVDWTDLDTAETGFEVQRSAADGTSTLFAVPSAGATTGPVRFTDTTASPGTRYAYRVRGVSAAGAGEFSEATLVRTQPSLGLTVKSGSLSGAGVDTAGSAILNMKYSFQPGSRTFVLSPVADGISVTIGGAGADQVVAVAPNDPNWAVTGSVASWTGAGTHVVVDTGRRTIRVDAGGLTFAAAPSRAPVRVEVTSGGSHGARTASWRGVSAGRYLYP